MLRQPSSLLDLPDELLGAVLSYCTLEDVLHLQQSCKRMQEVSQRREIWLSLLQGLDIDCSAWIPPSQPLHSTNTLEIREKIVSAFRMRQAWKDHGQLRAVKDTEIIFQEEGAQPREVSFEAKIVPGGQEVLVGRAGWYELWSLEKHELLWTAPPPEGNFFGSSADLELVQDGREIMIVCEFTSADEPIGNSVIRVYRYDRLTRCGEVVARISFPPIYCHDLEIRGDYIKTVVMMSNQRVIYNWKTGHGLNLSFTSDSDPDDFPLVLQYTTLTSSHILGVAKKQDDLFAFATPIDAFDGLWIQSNQYEEWTNHVHDPRVGAFIPLEHPNISSMEGQSFGTWILTMHAFRPIWKVNSPTELFILGYHLTATNVKRLISYRIQLTSPANSHSTIELERSQDSASVHHVASLTLVDAGYALSPVLPWDKSCMFNSGHIICLREQLRCFSLFKNTDEPLFTLELEDHPWQHGGNGPFATAVDPWTGNIVIVSNQRLMGYRFEPVDRPNHVA